MNNPTGSGKKKMAQRNPVRTEIKIPTEKVVALKYEAGDAAPKVIAKGSGYIAEKILETARESNVPVHEDEQLVSTLSALNLGDMVPDELFRVIAEIYVFVDKVDAILGKGERT